MVPNPRAALLCATASVQAHRTVVCNLVCGPQEGRIVPEEYCRSTAVAVDVIDPLLIQRQQADLVCGLQLLEQSMVQVTLSCTTSHLNAWALRQSLE